MKMTISDADLLKRYVEGHSNEAFEVLISRHSGLVYSAAVRQVGSLELAEDVAQSVFIALAQKASRLPSDVILSGWLYRATLFAASKALRSERRRENREKKALVMNSSDTDGESVWKQIEPYLDSAMGHLGNIDRSALVLRYFENKSLREVGTALGTSEDAAQKRVARALEKLRALFAQRKISVSSTALAGGLSAFSVEAAPMLLTSGISAAVSSASISPGGLISIAGILNKAFMVTKLKIAIAAGGV
jgi:RNA polymerase sigma factor (sigma-70 family)